jgi:antitoxin MazE
MNVNIVSIGTSKGIRIPKALLKQFNFKNSVDVKILPEGLLLQANIEPRAGWADIFANNVDENAEFLDWEEAPLTTFDEVEW